MSSPYDDDIGVVTAPRAGLGPAAALFWSLGDPARPAIVRRLADGQARALT